MGEIEPHVNGLAAIRVPSTGIVDYRRVAETMADLAEQQGVELLPSTRVAEIHVSESEVVVGSERATYRAGALVNCGGLHSDRLARTAGKDPGMRIMPFRGEYYRVKPEKQYLVKHLIYPVPNPNFPFLGVHFTRMVNGGLEAGPNAVLSFKREGYSRFAFNARDFAEIVGYPGMWKLAARYWREGAAEVVRS